MRYAPLFALGAVLALAACSGNSGTSGTHADTSAAPSAAPTNPSNFPIYGGSRIVATRNFTEKLTAADLKTTEGAFPQGVGTYAGHQVIARTDATMDQLSAWLTAISSAPPSGYRSPVEGAELAQARANVVRYGIDFAPFVEERNGTQVGFLVIALDPQMLDRKLGPAMGLLDNFRSLPEMLRAPVDRQVKASIGITATQALDPATPLGAALAAYDDVKSTSDRAIVVVDGIKQ